MRNRRYKQKLGPLVIYGEDNGIVRAFRNIPGVSLLNVERLNLLKVAPGGHLGRLIVWTESAFKKLDAIYGTYTQLSKLKKGFSLPRPKMRNPDYGRIVRSEEVSKAVRKSRKAPKVATKKINPLGKPALLAELNPYSVVLREAAHKKNPPQKA